MWETQNYYKDRVFYVSDYLREDNQNLDNLDFIKLT